MGKSEKFEMCNSKVKCSSFSDPRKKQCDTTQRDLRRRYPQVNLQPKWDMASGKKFEKVSELERLTQRSAPRRFHRYRYRELKKRFYRYCRQKSVTVTAVSRETAKMYNRGSYRVSNFNFPGALRHLTVQKTIWCLLLFSYL